MCGKDPRTSFQDKDGALLVYKIESISFEILEIFACKLERSSREKEQGI